jgi:hypothetical protein
MISWTPSISRRRSRRMGDVFVRAFLFFSYSFFLVYGGLGGETGGLERWLSPRGQCCTMVRDG